MKRPIRNNMAGHNCEVCGRFAPTRRGPQPYVTCGAKCRGVIKDWHRRLWAEANPDRIRRYNRPSARTRERDRRRRAGWTDAQRAARRAYYRAYYRANRAVMLARMNWLYRSNPGPRRAAARARHRRLMGMRALEPPAERPCALCSRPFVPAPRHPAQRFCRPACRGLAWWRANAR